MLINRELFPLSFSKKSRPSWQCPRCLKGHLKTSNDKFFLGQTAASRSEDPQYPYSEYVFTALMTCSNQICGESFIISGDCYINSDESYFDFEENKINEAEMKFKPHYFNPPLDLFLIPNRCPKNISNLIKTSFSLFWIDIESCANKIRIVVEHLLTHLKIPRSELINKKRKKIILHLRIQKLATVNNKLYTLLIAIKWLGNEGSHENSSLSRDDLFDAYDILNYAMIEVFGDSQKAIEKVAKQIIKRKGPRKK